MDVLKPGQISNKQLLLIILIAVVGIVLGSMVVIHFDKPRIKDNALGHMRRDSNGLPIQPSP
jgi:hypothetical protein